jgi:ribosome-binding protein aMBF1 (putative translation factor)
MAISAKAFLESRGIPCGSGNQRPQCAICGRPLQETVTGNRRTARGHLCSDCYFDELGRVIEEHPVTTAHGRG